MITKKAEANINYASLPNRWAEFMHALQDAKGKTIVEFNIWKDKLEAILEGAKMKPFVVDKTQLHFKLARLGGVKIKEERVSIYDAKTGKYTSGMKYELNIQDFCSYWRRVALGSLFAFLITGAVALYLTPILLFLTCVAVPNAHQGAFLMTAHKSPIFTIGGGMLVVSLLSATIAYLGTVITTRHQAHKKKMEKLAAEGKLPEKPVKVKKEKAKKEKVYRESLLKKAYRTHKEKYCVPVKLDVDGTFSE